MPWKSAQYIIEAFFKRGFILYVGGEHQLVPPPRGRGRNVRKQNIVKRFRFGLLIKSRQQSSQRKPCTEQKRIAGNALPIRFNGAVCIHVFKTGRIAPSNPSPSPRIHPGALQHKLPILGNET